MRKSKRFYAVFLSALLMLCLLTGCKEVPPTESTELSTAETSTEQTTVETTEALTESELETDPVFSNMEVHFIDVGQADCILIKTEDHNMLIDAGNNDDADTITTYLTDQGVTKLDYVIGTHPHEDHIGSLDVVIDKYDIGEVILPDKIHTSKTFEDVLNAIDNKGLGITTAVPGDTHALGSADFTIIAPQKDYGDDLNNWSVGVLLTNGDNTFLFAGDAENSAENDIISSGISLKADVFKASHHGSETSNTDTFIRAINPTYAVISCGTDNQYGHPDLSVLERFSNNNIQIFRTDEQGTIICISDGHNITWSCSPSTSMQPGTKPEETTTVPETTTVQATTKAPETQAQVEPLPETVAPPETPVPEVPADNQSVTVHITETGSKYHSAGCQYLRKSDIEVSLEDAKSRGLEPCSKCNPPR